MFQKGKRSSPRFSLEEEFEQKMVDLTRVTRVVAGGKRLRFRACIVVGDKKGKVGYGLGKGNDVATAMEKATRVAKKNLIEVPIYNNTIPHEIIVKFKAAKIMLKPAAEGRGLRAGSVVRTILSLSGIENVTAKILGAKSKINNTKATFLALERLHQLKNRQKGVVGK